MVLWVGWAHLRGSCLGSIVQLLADVSWGRGHQLATHARWLPHRALGRALSTRASACGLSMWLGLPITGHWVPRVSVPEDPCVWKLQVFLRLFEPILKIPHSAVFYCSSMSLSLPRLKGAEKSTPSLEKGVVRSHCRRGYGIGDIRATFGRYKLPQKIPWKSSISLRPEGKNCTSGNLGREPSMLQKPVIGGRVACLGIKEAEWDRGADNERGMSGEGAG